MNNTQKYFRKYFRFCEDIGEFHFTFRVKNVESKNMNLSRPHFFLLLETHNSKQVQINHVLFILYSMFQLL